MLGQDDNPTNMAEENQRARLQAPLPLPLGEGRGEGAASNEHTPPLTHGDLPPEPVSDAHAPYDPRSYMAQSVPKRMAIISAGVIMNVIFAFIMATIAYGLGVPETPCIVGGAWVGGAAWQAGLEPGDKITRIGNVVNPRFDDLRTGVTLGDVDKGIPFTIDRAATDKPEDIMLFPDSSLGLPMIGIIRRKTLNWQIVLDSIPRFRIPPLAAPHRHSKPATKSCKSTICRSIPIAISIRR